MPDCQNKARNINDVTEKRSQRAILICGMHRSGTSLFANILRDLGIPFGDNLLHEPMPDNEEGYGEHAGVVRIQEQLLKSLGREWHGTEGPLPLPDRWISRPETRAAGAELRAILEQEFSDVPVWALKDPRTSRLLPLWWQLLGERNVKASPILCLRHPDAVAASLARRNQMPPKQAYSAWVAHNRDVISAVCENTSQPKIIVVDYDDLLAAPEPVLQAALRDADVAVQPADLKEASARIKTRLRHHVARTKARPSIGSEAREAALDLYQQIHSGVRSFPTNSAPAEPVSATTTIVVRTLDRPAFLRRACASILNQSYSNWHVVVVNDGGDLAATNSVLEDYAPAFGRRIDVLHLPERTGMEAASNAAIALRGDPFIAIHDDDDSWHPRFLETCVGMLESGSTPCVVTCSTIVDEIFEEGLITEIGRRPFLSLPYRIDEADLRSHNLFPPIAFLFRRTLYRAAGPYREDLPVLGDWEFNMRVARLGPISVIPRHLAFWHARPASDPFPNSNIELHQRAEERLRSELQIPPRPTQRSRFAEAISRRASSLSRGLSKVTEHRARKMLERRTASDRLPDFLCIGAQRSGTTLLHHALEGHPDIFLPPCKELHALDAMAGMEPERWAQLRIDFLSAAAAMERRLWLKRPGALRSLDWARRFALSDETDMDWYASLFREAGPDQRAGECTPAYALLPPATIAAAAELMPDLQVFFLMRDPVERALSGAVHACTTAIGVQRRPSLAELDAAIRDPACIARSGYRATIERWTEQVSENRFHILLFDEFVSDPAPSLRRIYEVLNIRQLGAPKQWRGRVNANPIQIEWPRETMRALARQMLDECEWLANRYGGPTIRWAEHARMLANGP